jgi:SAM-dependent methyltransferase
VPAVSDQPGAEGKGPESAADDSARVALNWAMWDERVPIHVAGEFYGVEKFRADPGRLDVRSFEVDTLSWARLGATVTGLDFSGPAVDAANRLAQEIGIEADFVQADLYDAVAALDGRTFDVVYTGKGAVLWLPDIRRWAAVCAALVAPGGTFYLSEFHPVTDMFAYESFELERSYFETAPVFDDSSGTYADLEATTVHNASYEWLHPLSSVVTALIEAGLQIEFLHEHDYTLFPRWPFLESRDDGSFVFPAGMPRIPLMYSLRARRPAAD